MNASDKKQRMSEGLWLDGRKYFGSDNNGIRAEFKKAGAVFDSKSTRWVFPSAKAINPFRRPASVPASAPTPSLPPIGSLIPPSPTVPAVSPTNGNQAVSTPKPQPASSQTTPKLSTPTPAFPTKNRKQFLKSLPPAGLPKPAETSSPKPPRLPKPVALPISPPALPTPAPALPISPPALPTSPPSAIPQPDTAPIPLPNTQPLPSPQVSEKTPEPVKDSALNGTTIQVGTWSRASLMQLPAGLLVLQTVSIKGAVEYLTEDETREYIDNGGTITSDTKKTTRRIVTDEEEYNRTKKVTNDFRKRIRDFGVGMLPSVTRVRKTKRKEVDAVMRQIRAETLEHNKTARYHTIRLFMACIETSEEEREWAQQYALLLQEGMDAIRQAIDACDVKKIRDEAQAFKKLAEQTEKDDSKLILDAVAEARQIAKFVDREVNKKSRQISDVKQRINTDAIDSIRMRFLQYEVPPAMEEARPSVEKNRYADLAKLDPAAELAPMAVNGGIEPGRFSNGN